LAILVPGEWGAVMAGVSTAGPADDFDSDCAQASPDKHKLTPLPKQASRPTLRSLIKFIASRV
jgi:hypothetical protein